MKYWILIVLVALTAGCHVEHENEAPAEEVSLYNEHDGITLPEEMQRELGLQVSTVTDTNLVPENAIIRGAREDFTYVRSDGHFVRTLLGKLEVGDQVVTHGVKDLWRIELLAVRGGQPCCPAGD